MKNRIALITGASRGLGKSMALHLADAGVDVVLTYKSAEAEAHAVAKQIEAKGRKALALQLDVGKSATFPAFAATVKSELSRRFGRTRFDHLVNNAGVAAYASVADTTEAQFDEQLAVSLKGTFFLTQALLPLLEDGGRILNMSTGLARFTMPGYAAYAVMKGGVEVLTRYLAQELGPRRITVNVIAPGGIETDFGGGALRDDKAMNAAVAAQTPQGRVGLPDDIGRAVAMLLSEDSQWITGQRFEATGGFML